MWNYNDDELLFIGAIVAVILFVVFVLIQPKQVIYQQVPIYINKYVPNPVEQPEPVNMDSVIIGGHNSSHGSSIIGSPYKPY